MSKYVSRTYLREKWNKLKWDVEQTLDVYGEHNDGDRVDPDDVERCAANISLNAASIVKELIG